MFGFNFGKSSKDSSKVKNTSKRSLRLEPLEDRLLLSVSPLSSSDQGEIIPWPLPESHMEEIRVALENTREKGEMIAQSGSAPDHEKVEQLVASGNATKAVKGVTDSNEVVTNLYVTREYMEALGTIVPYVSANTVDDLATPEVLLATDADELNPLAEEYMKVMGSITPYETPIASIVSQLEELENTTLEDPEWLKPNEHPDYEKFEQLRKEGKVFGFFESVTESGESMKVPYFTDEYVEAMGPGVPYADAGDGVGQNELDEVVENMLGTTDSDVQNKLVPNFVKMEQLVREGKSGTYIEKVTDSGEILRVPCFTNEFVEAMGSGVSYMTTDSDALNTPSDDEWVIDLEKIEQLRKEGRISKEIEWVTKDGTIVKGVALSDEYIALLGPLGLCDTDADELNSLADISDASLSEERYIDLEKIEQLRKEGRISKEIEWVTKDGTVMEGVALSEEYIELIGPIDLCITTVDSPANHVVTSSSGQYSGVSYIVSAGFAATGTLLSTGTDVLTCAHLFFDQDTGARTGYANNTIVYFDTPSGRQAFTVLDVIPHPDYTVNGVGSYSDLAIVKIVSAAPSSVTRYDIFRDTTDLTSSLITFTKVGYGRYGSGQTGDTNPQDGNKRVGFNTYDAFYLNEKMLCYDFDNGSTARDALGNELAGKRHLGLGNNEVMNAPGDSGGPGFVNVNGSLLIAGVTLGRSRTNYDIDSTINSSFGEIGIDVNVSYFASWIDSTIKPSTPTGLTATPQANTSNQIMLTWDATPGATSYTVQRSTNGSTWSTLSSNVTTNNYTSSGLAANTTYHYRILAKNSIGSSSYSTNTTAKTSPVAPTGVTATPVPNTSNQINLAWTAPSGATSYTLQRSADGVSGWVNVISNTESTTYTNTGRAANTTYYYRVFAKNSTGGSSPYSMVVNATTNPATPTGLTAAPVASTSNQIRLTWTASSGATNYTVQRSTNGTTWANTATTASTSYTYSSLSAGTLYYFRVLAKNSGGSSPYSTAVTATTNPAAPAAPSGLTATPVPNTSNQVGLTWTASSGATSYTVQRSTNGTTWANTATTASTSYTYSSLSPGALYYFRVLANNSGGASPYSTAVTATTNPAIPTGFTAAPVANTSDRIKLTWTATSGATGYTISRSTDGTNWYYQTTVSGGNVTSHTYTAFAANTIQYFKISANGSGGSSAFSSVISAKTSPLTPSGLTATPVANTSDRIQLTWAASPGAASYTVQRSLTGTGSWTNLISTLTTNSYTNTELSDNTTYYYRVLATNSTGGTSPYSSVVNAKTPVQAETTLVIRDDGAEIPAGASVANLDTLEGRKTWSHEWDSFTVEIWGNSKYSNEALRTFTCELVYDPSLYQLRSMDSIIAGAGFNFTTQSIDQVNGKITLSGTTTSTTIGTNTNALLAQVQFVPGTLGVIVPQVGYAVPVSSGFDLSSIQYTLRNSSTAATQTATSNVNGLEDFPIYPVLYDLDDSGIVNMLDIDSCIRAFGKTIDDPSTSTYARSDFDYSGIINIMDINLLMRAYGKQKGPDVQIAFPSWFPNGWPQLSSSSGSPIAETPINWEEPVSEFVMMQECRDFYLGMMREALQTQQTERFETLAQGALFDYLFSEDKSWVPAFKAQWSPQDVLVTSPEISRNSNWMDETSISELAEIDLYYRLEEYQNAEVLDTISTDNAVEKLSLIDHLVCEPDFLEEPFLPFESWNVAIWEKSLNAKFLPLL